jgi:hypothetical protein
MTTPTDPRRMYRIPLPGNLDGIAVELPGEPVTTEQWEFFLRVLDAWRPALIATEGTTP